MEIAYYLERTELKHALLYMESFSVIDMHFHTENNNQT